MTIQQLEALGQLAAIMEHASNGEITPALSMKILKNPADQAFEYWFAELARMAVQSGNDALGLKLAELRDTVGYSLSSIAPVQTGVAQVAYYKTKADVNKIDMRKAFGEKVKSRRESMGLTTYGLADMTGLERSHISRIESGKYNVTIDTIAKLGSVLGDLI